tara:strand:- start:887 stop:1246 length:360 start_codon:yes stop_codon:yes gene_type:complete
MKTLRNLLLVVFGIIILFAVFEEDTPNELTDTKMRARMLLTKEAKSIIKYTKSFKHVEFVSVKQGDTLTSKLYYTAKNLLGVSVERCASVWVMLNEDDSVNVNAPSGNIKHNECKHTIY